MVAKSNDGKLVNTVSVLLEVNGSGVIAVENKEDEEGYLVDIIVLFLLNESEVKVSMVVVDEAEVDIEVNLVDTNASVLKFEVVKNIILVVDARVDEMIDTVLSVVFSWYGIESSNLVAESKEESKLVNTVFNPTLRF